MRKSQEVRYKYKLIIAVVGLISLVIGTFGSFLVENYLKPPNLSEALAQQFDHVYVFIRCAPQHPYFDIGTLQTNSLTRIATSTENKKGVGKVLTSIGQSLLGEIQFEERLKQVVDEARKSKPNVQAIIFNKDLTSCELIRFK